MISIILLLLGIIILLISNKKESNLIEFYIEKSQKISVYIAKEDKTTEMPLEKYILGVVAGEMPASYSEEALKAQAVCARTYTLHKINSGGCKKYNADICTDSRHCQAFLTNSQMTDRWGKDYNKYLEKIEGCIISTNAQILTYDDKPIEALYHAVSGGMTEDCVNVYKNDVPYLKSVESSGEEGYSKFKSEVAVTLTELAEKLEVKNKPVTNLEDIIGNIERFESGRIKTIEILGKSLTGTEMRKLFSLNSANFQLSLRGNEVVFNVTGYGHGVGLSQAGADAMAKNNANYIEILKHYFTDVELTNLNIKNISN